MLFIALVLLNEAFPLRLGIAAMLMITERIAINGKEETSSGSVAVLEFTKVGLTELVQAAVAAGLFHAMEGETRVDLDMSVADMFDETPDGGCLLGGGPHEQPDCRVAFELWRRNEGARENDDSTMINGGIEK